MLTQTIDKYTASLAHDLAIVTERREECPISLTELKQRIADHTPVLDTLAADALADYADGKCKPL